MFPVLSYHFRKQLLCAVVMLALIFVSVGCQTMQAFRKSSGEKVSSARSWARDGFAAVKEGHLARAKTCFSNAARDLPDDHRLVGNLARTEFEQGNVDLAIATMSQALEKSENPNLRVELGEMRLAAGQLQAANDDAEIALQRDYSLASAWQLKGKLAAAQGDQQTALQYFQRAVGLDRYSTHSEELQLQIADSYMKMDKPMQAFSAIETLLGNYAPESQPDEAVLAKAEALIAMQRPGPAIEALQVASRRPASSKEIFFQLGKAQLLAGQRERAYQTLVRGREAFPQEPIFGELLATVSPTNTPFVAGPKKHRVASVPASEVDSSR